MISKNYSVNEIKKHITETNEAGIKSSKNIEKWMSTYSHLKVDILDTAYSNFKLLLYKNNALTPSNVTEHRNLQRDANKLPKYVVENLEHYIDNCEKIIELLLSYPELDVNFCGWNGRLLIQVINNGHQEMALDFINHPTMDLTGQNGINALNLAIEKKMLIVTKEIQKKLTISIKPNQ